MNGKEITYSIIAEGSLLGFLYYIQVLLRVSGDLLVSTIVLWVLLNLAIVFCPIVRKCYHYNYSK